MSARICLITVLGVVFLVGQSTTSAEAACRWVGEAPSCGGEPSDCNANEEPGEYAAAEYQVKTTRGKSAKFGKECIFGGFKQLCCTKVAAPTTPPPPPLSTPNAQFCDWYAAEASNLAKHGHRCGFTGFRWTSPPKGHHNWCMAQKTQQQVWSEHNARKAQFVECTKAEAQKSKATPGKGNFSKGPPEVTVDADVDIYDKPGGAGTKLGILREGSKVSLFERRPDQWCGVSGNPVGPNGVGFVWCGKGFELD